ncbi:Conserved protein of unknown function [Mycobacterium canettii CIPT 140070010]|nr:Conserved protein of unknown function [Mycobacterium canettii CIPT 140070010]
MLTLPDDRAPTGLPDPGIEALAHTKIASTISTVVADGYAVVLSTADIANSLLANAIGYPICCQRGVGHAGSGCEFLVLAG